MIERFDCPNCGQLEVTAQETCPDAATHRRSEDHPNHSPKHLHVAYVSGCAACAYKDHQMSGFPKRSR